MNYKETQSYIEHKNSLGIHPGLDAVLAVLSELKHPERELPAIHIAGTNGKGSIMSFIESTLIASGLKVGRYISPALSEYRERWTVNRRMPEKEKVAELLNKGIIDMAQLHGNEDEEYIKKLRELAPDKPVIKAFVVKDEESITRAKECGADYLLLDSGKGTGKTFNWELIKTADFDKPFFLAGGLDPSNVAEAINVLSPYAVDVSSGIESEGHKDPEKMKEFKECCRSVLTT